jgi:hypothetical protein
LADPKLLLALKTKKSHFGAGLNEFFSSKLMMIIRFNRLCVLAIEGLNATNKALIG